MLLNDEERLALEDAMKNTELSIDDRVLAWAQLHAWGYGQEFACCPVGDLRAPRAKAIIYNWHKDGIRAARNELVAASQNQCASELGVPVQRVRTAVAHLVKRGLLTTKWVYSQSLVTKHKLGQGFRAHVARAWCGDFILSASKALKCGRGPLLGDSHTPLRKVALFSASENCRHGTRAAPSVHDGDNP